MHFVLDIADSERRLVSARTYYDHSATLVRVGFQRMPLEIGNNGFLDLQIHGSYCEMAHSMRRRFGTGWDAVKQISPGRGCGL